MPAIAWVLGIIFVGFICFFAGLIVGTWQHSDMLHKCSEIVKNIKPIGRGEKGRAGKNKREK